MTAVYNDPRTQLIDLIDLFMDPAGTACADIQQVLPPATPSASLVWDVFAGVYRSTEPQVVQAARPAANRFVAAYHELHSALLQATADQAEILTDARFTQEEQQRQLDDLVTGLASSTTATLATMTEAADELERIVAPLARPPRPASIDEGRLAGLKSDARMVLDRLEELDDICLRIVEFLLDATASGDDHAVWLFGGSGWVRLYLESRNLEHLDRVIDVQIGRALDTTATGDVEVARQLLGVLEGTGGVATLVGRASAAVVRVNEALRLKTKNLQRQAAEAQRPR